MKYILLSLSILFATASMSAQSYGHCNFGQLLSLMPATTAADKELKSLNDKMVAEGQAKVKALQEKITVYAKLQQNGTVSPLEQQNREDALNKERDAILQFEQEIAQKVEQKRRELLGPVINAAKQAIEDVAKERGYKLVFDTSIFNAVMYAEESIDMMEAVKTKLGLE